MRVKEILAELGVRPAKGRGQNFLHDTSVAAKIAAFVQIQPDERVLEIGPGLGMLTRELLGHTELLWVVEIEPVFADYLQRELPQLTAERVIQRDVRQVQLAELVGDGPWVVASNVPYSISSEVVLWLLDQREVVRRASLLLQREFAERIAAEPGSKEYGAITVRRALYADARLGPVFPGTVFHPRANVESRLLELRMLDQPRVSVADDGLFRDVVRASFSTRRKTMLNCLVNGKLCDDKPSAREVLAASAIDEQARPETLDVAAFRDCVPRFIKGERCE